MASVISINTEVARTIYNNSGTAITNLRGELTTLDTQIMKLTTEGQWKGDAADKFMNTYNGMRNKIKKEFPQLLDDLNKNLDTNLKNLVAADAAGK